MSRLKLRDLPREAVEKLKPLGHPSFQMLAIDAVRLREHEATRDFPTDPLEALKGVWEVFGRKPEGVEDDHMEDIQNAVRVVSLVLSSVEDLGQEDCRRLWAVLDRAETLLRWERQSQEEQRQRMYKALEARRAEEIRQTSPAAKGGSDGGTPSSDTTKVFLRALLRGRVWTPVRRAAGISLEDATAATLRYPAGER
jgi:hypothetical protein